MGEHLVYFIKFPLMRRSTYFSIIYREMLEESCFIQKIIAYFLGKPKKLHRKYLPCLYFNIVSMMESF